jgi:hypothetical protein
VFISIHADQRIRDIATPYLNQSPYLANLIKGFKVQPLLRIYSNRYRNSIEKLIRELDYDNFYSAVQIMRVDHDSS